MRFSVAVAFTVLAEAFVPAFTAPLRNSYPNGAQRDVSVSDGLNRDFVHTPK